MRVLIVSADDFGRSRGINSGVIKAHEEGIVTSAGLMVCWPDAEEAATYARRNRKLAVGLHVDLAEWVHGDDGWTTVYERVSVEDAAAIEREVRSQFERFRELVGAEPTHLDSHQHLHAHVGPVGPVLEGIATDLGIPIRHIGDDVRYDGSFYGQNVRGDPLHEAITTENLISLIRGLPDGITELSCHPAIGDDSGSPYRRERELEVDALCDPRVRDAIAEEGIELRSFGDASSGR
jgi:chitin disaccharide deacetylase